MKRYSIIFLILCMFSALARGSDETDNYVMPVNVSVYPGLSLGEHLAEGRPITNHVSFNIIAGRAERLEGIELGVILNRYRERVTGAQWAGIANLNGVDVRGAQWAGIVNQVRGTFIGAQWAGVVNKVNADGILGAQWAGIANLNRAGFRGAQWAGVINQVRGTFIGAQWAGITNQVCSEGILGAQWAGIANLNGDDVCGTQWAGIMNQVDGTFVGAQWAGIVNNVGSLKTGIQFAGLVNVAEDVKHGVQIGLINVSQENEGIPLGPISYVGDVGFGFDAWIDETRFVNTGLRSGSERFYNIMFAGAQVDESHRWTMGWIFGGHMDLQEKTCLDIDVSGQHINESVMWTDELNTLYKLRVLFGMQIHEKKTLYAGPTLNYLVSDVHDGSDFITSSIREEKSGGHWKCMWPGFVIGIKY